MKRIALAAAAAVALIAWIGPDLERAEQHLAGMVHR